MQKKDLVMNVEFLNSKGSKGRIIKIEDEIFTVLWVETGQMWDYPFDEGLLNSLVIVSKKEKIVEQVPDK